MEEQTKINLQRCSRASVFAFSDPSPLADLFLLPLHAARPAAGSAEALKKQLGLAACEELLYLEAGLPLVLYHVKPATPAAREELLDRPLLLVNGLEFVRASNQESHLGPQSLQRPAQEQAAGLHPRRPVPQAQDRPGRQENGQTGLPVREGTLI